MVILTWVIALGLWKFQICLNVLDNFLSVLQFKTYGCTYGFWTVKVCHTYYTASVFISRRSSLLLPSLCCETVTACIWSTTPLFKHSRLYCTESCFKFQKLTECLCMNCIEIFNIVSFQVNSIRTLLLAHLSWKLKWAFLITCPPSSVCPSVCLSVNFSHFHLLLQNHWANFNQTWHKVSLGKGDSSLFKWRATPFPKGR